MPLLWRSTTASAHDTNSSARWPITAIRPLIYALAVFPSGPDGHDCLAEAVPTLNRVGKMMDRRDHVEGGSFRPVSLVVPVRLMSDV